MSAAESSPSDRENCCVDGQESPEDRKDDDATKETSCLSSGSPDRSAIQRVLKEVGLTSTTFIGPEFPPDTAKSNIDDTLDEFYKEINMINTSNAAEDNPGAKVDFVQPHPPPATTTGTDRNEGNKCLKPFNDQQSSWERPSSWSHWYQNEPYLHRRPRQSMDLMHSETSSNRSHWRSQTINRPEPPNLRDSRPPLHHLHTFPYPQNPPLHRSQSRGGSPVHPPYYYSPPQNIPPSNVGCHSSQVPLRDSLQDCDHLAYSGDNVNFRLSQDRNQQWSRLDDNYDRQYSGDSEDPRWTPHWQPPDNMNGCHSTLVLILMRGLPGSGKSTMARELLFNGPNGLILSTDDYFAHRDGYHYDAGCLGEAHEWNQSRAENAMRDGRSPIIIDNTNLQAWEMKPYVRMALKWGYSVDFCEPDTSWKFDPYELEKRNKHGVPHQKIAQMMDRFSFPISIDIVMNSQDPRHVNRRMMKQKQDFY